MFRGLFLFSFLFVSLQGIEFTLENEVEIEKENVYLSDLIKPISDPVIHLQTNGIFITKLKYSERFKNISAKEIREKARDYFAEELIIEGGVSIIRWREEIISKEEINSQIIDFVKRKFGENTQAKIQSTPEIKVPQDQIYSLNLSLVDDVSTKGNILVKITVSIEQENKIYTIPVKLFQEQFVWRLKESKNRGEVIQKNDLISSKEETTYLNDVIYDEDEIAGKLASKYVPAGTIITEKTIKNEPLIKRGEIIDIMVINDNITLRTQAIAREDGYKNDKIFCQNPDTKEKYKVLVTGRNNAIINLGE